MSRLNTQEVHERRHRRIFDRRALESLFTNFVHHEINDLKLDGEVGAVDYKVEDTTEGSPGYKVGTKCIVAVIEVLTPPRRSWNRRRLAPLLHKQTSCFDPDMEFGALRHENEAGGAAGLPCNATRFHAMAEQDVAVIGDGNVLAQPNSDAELGLIQHKCW